MKRWSEFLDIKINIKPKFFPPIDPHIPAKYTIAANFKIDFNELSSLAKSEKVSKIYTDNTEEAVQKNVFGAPTYIFNNELFWGQDRLEFLERALRKA